MQMNSSPGKKKMCCSTLKLTAAVLTISDSCARGERVDQSGPAVTDLLKKHRIEVIAAQIIPDDQEAIQDSITSRAQEAMLVVTTGGTGITPRDVTPEATRAVCGRMIDGIPERMRFEGAKKTPFAALSRGVCGIHGSSLILNLPGSPGGAVESLSAVIDLLPHALELLRGNSSHT